MKKIKAKWATIIIGVIFGALALYLIPYGFELRERAIRAMEGELTAPQIDFQNPFVVNFGSNIIVRTVDELSTGINLSNYISFGYDYPIQIKFRDEKLLISADIKNEKGEVVAKITDNQWTVSQDKILARDRNYNDYALEVIDPDLVTVLQVVVQNPNTIYIGGLFYLPNGRVLATPTGLGYNPSPESINEHLERIFRYPSEDHLGEMAVLDTFNGTPLELTKANWVIIIGVIFGALGLFLVPYGFFVLEKKEKIKQRKRKGLRHIKPGKNKS